MSRELFSCADMCSFNLANNLMDVLTGTQEADSHRAVSRNTSVTCFCGYSKAFHEVKAFLALAGGLMLSDPRKDVRMCCFLEKCYQFSY